MNYNTLQSLLPNDEINYISDSTQFFIDNKIKSKQFKNNTFILFEYTIDYIDNTIKQVARMPMLIKKRRRRRRMMMMMRRRIWEEIREGKDKDEDEVGEGGRMRMRRMEEEG